MRNSRYFIGTGGIVPYRTVAWSGYLAQAFLWVCVWRGGKGKGKREEEEEEIFSFDLPCGELRKE